MPITTWKSYATKVRKKPKSDFYEYIRATPLWLSRKTEHSDSDEQSREIQKEEKEEINEKDITQEKVVCPYQGRRQGLSETDRGRQEAEERIVWEKEEKEVKNLDAKLPFPKQGTSVEESLEKVNMKLRPPIEIYEELDDAIEEHLERVHHGKESAIRKRSKIQSSRSVSSEERGIESSSRCGSNRKKEIRGKENG